MRTMQSGIHAKTVPVLLTTAEEWDTWLSAPVEGALSLQLVQRRSTARPLFMIAAVFYLNPAICRTLAMLRQLLLGGLLSLGNIAIHAVAMTAVLDAARFALQWERRRPQLWLTGIMVATVGVLLVAHVAEVTAWSLTYWILGAAPPGPDVLYFAFVNYATLGYGDIVPVERWRLLGPMTAMNGILLFGWSTAVIFEVLTRAMQHPDRRKNDKRDRNLRRLP